MAKRTADNGKRVLFLVHRRELCDQIENTFTGYGVDMSLCTIGMVQTITRRVDKIHRPDLIITDENLLQTAPNIINGFPYTLLGKPVYLSDNMPLPEKDSKVILYGDYSGLSVNMREHIEMQLLNESYYTMHAVGICAWLELDSKLTEKQKLAVMQMSAA